MYSQSSRAANTNVNKSNLHHHRNPHQMMMPPSVPPATSAPSSSSLLDTPARLVHTSLQVARDAMIGIFTPGRGPSRAQQQRQWQQHQHQQRQQQQQQQQQRMVMGRSAAGGSTSASALAPVVRPHQVPSSATTATAMMTAHRRPPPPNPPPRNGGLRGILAALTPSRRLIGAGRHPNQPLPGRAGVGAGTKKQQPPAKPKPTQSAVKATAAKPPANAGTTSGRGGSISSSSAAVVSVDSSDAAADVAAKSPAASMASKNKDVGSRDSTPKMQNRTLKTTTIPSAEKKTKKAKSLFSDIESTKKALEEKQVAMEDRFKLLESKLKVREATLASREKTLEVRSKSFEDRVVEWREEVDTARAQFRTAREAEERKLRDSARDVFDEAKRTFEEDVATITKKASKTPLSAREIDGVGASVLESVGGGGGGSRAVVSSPPAGDINQDPTKTPVPEKNQSRKRRKAEVKEEPMEDESGGTKGSTSSSKKAALGQSGLSKTRIEELFKNPIGGGKNVCIPRQVEMPASIDGSMHPTSPLSSPVTSISKPKTGGKAKKSKRESGLTPKGSVAGTAKKITPKPDDTNSSKKRRAGKTNASTNQPSMSQGGVGRTDRRKKHTRQKAKDHFSQADDANFIFR